MWRERPLPTLCLSVTEPCVCEKTPAGIPINTPIPSHGFSFSSLSFLCLKMRAGLQALILAFGGKLALGLGQKSFPDADSDVLANLERFWSYGRSPAVYPSRKCQGCLA